MGDHSDNLTINYGLRYDAFRPSIGKPAQPARQRGVEADRHHHHPCRLCALFLAAALRAGGQPDVALFNNTTAAAPATPTTRRKAERADYFDVGMEQKLFGDWTVGLDSFYKASNNLIDEGQFGAPIILTPFNYAKGRQYGAELTVNYQPDNFTAYVNASYERAVGKNIVSSQFQFDPGDLAYIANTLYSAGSSAAGLAVGRRVLQFGEGTHLSAPTCSMAPACARTAPRPMAIMCRTMSRSISASARISSRRLEGPDGALRRHQCL